MLGNVVESSQRDVSRKKWVMHVLCSAGSHRGITSTSHRLTVALFFLLTSVFSAYSDGCYRENANIAQR